jgi:putative flavoprotein involved in K+ transport
MSSLVDVIIIGAGHAGLSISYRLGKLNLSHFVLEKGKIGNSWRNQRWDSFKLNTPNDINLLPGIDNIFPDSEGFCTAQEFISFLEYYAEKFNLPVRQNCEVISVSKSPDAGFTVICRERDQIKEYHSKQVVIASGGQIKEIKPSFSGNISSAIMQIHTGSYKNASSLPEGAVLIVGCAQSGIQIAEDLIEQGKKVYISTCQVGRFPRRYRGKDIVHWLFQMGFFDLLTSDVTDEKIIQTRQPQISATGPFGHTLSLQSLARKGAMILGKTDTAKGVNVFLQPNAADHVRFANEISYKVKHMVDEYIQLKHLTTPAPEMDPADEPDDKFTNVLTISKLNLIDNNITSVIWATGFTGDFSYIKLPVVNPSGSPLHNEGISPVEGLFFLGLPWLRQRKSGIIAGIREDSEFITGKIKSMLTQELSSENLKY